jgi:DNA-binding MarR family transcriptional regulator
MINIRDAHIKLLIELSDDQGHSNKELAESLKCTREYITMLFKELNKNIFIVKDDQFFLAPRDLNDPIALAAKLRSPKGVFEREIHDRLSEASKKLIETDTDPEKIRPVLLDELNSIILDPYLIDEVNYSDIQLSNETQWLKDGRPQEKEIFYLNRFLLEDAFPKELKSLKKNVIIKKLTYKIGLTEGKTRIKSNLIVFGFILDYFKERDREYDCVIRGVNKKIEASMGKNVYAKARDEEEYKKLKLDVLENTKSKGKNIYDWVNESNRNFDILETFLRSRYVQNLVRTFGIKELMDLLEFSDMTEKVRIGMLNDAYDNEIITREELVEEKERLDLKEVDFSGEKVLWQESGRLSRYPDIEGINRKEPESQLSINGSSQKKAGRHLKFLQYSEKKD